MKFYKLLGISLIIIFAFIVYNTLIENASISYIKEIEFQKQKTEVQLALVSFYSYYHVWPCSAGYLNTQALEELIGLDESHINKQHINFFKINHISPALTDSAGFPLKFEPDRSMGACIVMGSNEKAGNK